MNFFYEWFINFKLFFDLRIPCMLNCKNCCKRVETNSSSGLGGNSMLGRIFLRHNGSVTQARLSRGEGEGLLCGRKTLLQHRKVDFVFPA